jgi:predicted component of type VI protein secretion system
MHKGIILYQHATGNKNFKFVIDYIEQIINSSLRITAKKHLFKAENKNIFSIIYHEIKIIRPELAELYFSIVN